MKRTSSSPQPKTNATRSRLMQPTGNTRSSSGSQPHRAPSSQRTTTATGGGSGRAVGSSTSAPSISTYGKSAQEMRKELVAKMQSKNQQMSKASKGPGALSGKTRTERERDDQKFRECTMEEELGQDAGARIDVTATQQRKPPATTISSSTLPPPGGQKQVTTQAFTQQPSGHRRIGDQIPKEATAAPATQHPVVVVGDVAELIWKEVGVASVLNVDLLSRFYTNSAEACFHRGSSTAAESSGSTKRAPTLQSMDFHPCDTEPRDCSFISSSGRTTSCEPPFTADDVQLLTTQLWWTLHDTTAHCILCANRAANGGVDEEDEEDTSEQSVASGEKSRRITRFKSLVGEQVQKAANATRSGYRSNYSSANQPSNLPRFGAQEWLFVVKCLADLGYPRGEMLIQMPHRANVDELVAAVLWLTHRYGLVRQALHFRLCDLCPEFLVSHQDALYKDAEEDTDSSEESSSADDDSGEEDASSYATPRSSRPASHRGGGATPQYGRQIKKNEAAKGDQTGQKKPVQERLAAMVSMQWPPTSFRRAQSSKYRRHQADGILQRFGFHKDGSDAIIGQEEAEAHYSGGGASATTMERRQRRVAKAAAQLKRIVHNATTTIRDHLLLRVDQLDTLGLRCPNDAELSIPKHIETYERVMEGLSRVASMPVETNNLLTALHRFSCIVSQRLLRAVSMLDVYDARAATTITTATTPMPSSVLQDDELVGGSTAPEPCDDDIDDDGTTMSSSYLAPSSRLMKCDDMTRCISQFLNAGADATIQTKWQSLRRRLNTDSSVRGGTQQNDADALLQEMQQTAATIAENLDSRYTFPAALAAEIALRGSEQQMQQATAAWEKQKKNISFGGGGRQRPAAADDNGADDDVGFQLNTSCLLPVEQNGASATDGATMLNYEATLLTFTPSLFMATGSQPLGPRGSRELMDTPVGIPASGRTTSGALEAQKIEVLLNSLQTTSTTTTTTNDEKTAIIKKALAMNGCRLVSSMDAKALLRKDDGGGDGDDAANSAREQEYLPVTAPATAVDPVSAVPPATTQPPPPQGKVTLTQQAYEYCAQQPPLTSVAPSEYQGANLPPYQPPRYTLSSPAAPDVHRPTSAGGAAYQHQQHQYL